MKMIVCLLVFLVPSGIWAQQKSTGTKEWALAVSIVGVHAVDLNLRTITQSDSILGVVFHDRSLWITAAGFTDTAQSNLLFEVGVEGVLFRTIEQPTQTEFGWRDLATDGVYLYGSDSNVIEQIDPSSGLVTGVRIPIPIDVGRALAYDPDRDHFWTANWTSDLIGVDRAGNVIGQWPNPHWVYGMAWQPATRSQPATLWIWHQDVVADGIQIDPLTGVEQESFHGRASFGAAGGAFISDDFLSDGLVFYGVHQDSDILTGYFLKLGAKAPVP